MGLYSEQRSSEYPSSLWRIATHSDQIGLLVGFQVVLILCVSVGYLVIVSYLEALASIYGGCMAIFSTWMLIVRVRLAIGIAKNEPGREVRVLYTGAIQRFVLVLILFVVGMAILDLSPAPLLIGFTVPQGVLFVGAYLYSFHSSGWRIKGVIR
uniref:ATP synthase I chain n=1 Tax=Candidatus Kentrum sp. FW TaxID=2126338 RepID=A0A450SBH1_9GAMM|nr:MAG: ATP synthase I chain [Candidatus Kentron sp. FW]